MDKYVAVYVRRSVSDIDKGNNSMSIQAQKEDCIRYAQDCYPCLKYRVYCDDGKSAKDIMHRPSFLQMMEDAKNGQIEVIIVKKYDRFSRNTRDYLNVTNELQKHGVGVISLSEPFDTATKEGRMMRGIVLQFAEFERETIAGRVKDAYDIKAKETGFYQGGQIYFGYRPERQCVNGKMGSVLVPSEVADTVRIIFQMYSRPDVSSQDIVNYINANNINTTFTDRNNKPTWRPLSKPHILKILTNPLYVKADINVYRYLKAQGYKIIDDVTAFDGIHGVFRHTPESKDRYAKLGYHIGLVESNVWLAVQEKIDSFPKHRNRAKPFNSWLSGLMKCAHCGYAVCVNRKTHTNKLYLNCTGWSNSVRKCVKKSLKIRPYQVEEIVLDAMRKKFETLVVKKSSHNQPDTELLALQSELLTISNQLEELVEQIPKASNTLLKYIDQKVTELDNKKSEVEGKIERLTRKHQGIDVDVISEPLQYWDSLTVNEKYCIAHQMIDVVKISDETGVEIVFSI